MPVSSAPSRIRSSIGGVRLHDSVGECKQYWNGTRAEKKSSPRAEVRRRSMSMYPRELGPIPEETARVARAACPKGTLAMRLRDSLGELSQDEQFAALSPVEGQPA